MSLKQPADGRRRRGGCHHGVTVVSQANPPVAVAHVVLSHSPKTSVDPATLEAELVGRADEAVAAAARRSA